MSMASAMWRSRPRLAASPNWCARPPRRSIGRRSRLLRAERSNFPTCSRPCRQLRVSMAENAPFVRAVRVEAIPEGGLERFIEAGEAERFALARLNGVSTIGRLEAKFSLRRAGRGIVRVSGDVRAEATQTCVVSLEPLDVVSAEEGEVRFAGPARDSQ